MSNQLSPVTFLRHADGRSNSKPFCVLEAEAMAKKTLQEGGSQGKKNSQTQPQTPCRNTLLIEQNQA
jgi:hypothetical protein